MRNSMDCAKKGLYQSTTSLIIFYEDKNFQGGSYEASSDCPELTSNLSRCNSFKVESGCFMIYEKAKFKGPQKLVRIGEYPDHQRLVGLNKCDCIRSCRMVPMNQGPFKIRIYERENFSGQMHELTEDCDSTQRHYRLSDYHSCNVMDGHWLLYEDPNFRGRELYMGPGEYKTMNDMNRRPMDTRFGSLRCIMES